MDIEALTHEQILAIPEGKPERLFENGHAPAMDDLRDMRLRLLQRWHPDANPHPQANQVFQHIGVLYRAAVERLANSTWAQPSTLTFAAKDGKRYNFRYKKVHAFELGSMAIGHESVVFVIDTTHEKLYMNGVRSLGSIKFPDDKVRKEHERYIPVISKVFDTAEHHAMVVKKTKDVVLLRDLLDHVGGKLDPKHTAWIVSSLLNIACFYQISGMTHNGLSAGTVFVSPEFHAAIPVGGWWYSARAGAEIKQLPPSSHALASREILTYRKANISLDLECIKSIGRVCLGDPTGSTFRTRSDIPNVMANFLKLPSSGDAIKDYAVWSKKVLLDSFGPRRFTKLLVTGDGVYN